jgi:site-specific DNA recombinase
MTRAVLYARVSSDDSRKEGRNLSGQLDMARQYAAEHGYEVVAELAEDDHGASGAAFELPQLSRVLELASGGQFEVLIVRELDRLSRNLAKQLIVEEELRRAKVRIEYVLGEYADTPEGTLSKLVRASVAEYERLKIVERNIRGKTLKVKAGSVMMNGNHTYGYRKVERGGLWVLEVCEEEARVVRMIFNWYAHGDGASEPLSLREIQTRLLALHVPPPTGPRSQDQCRPWARSTLLKMLSNRSYIGLWDYNGCDGQVYTVQIPPIIEPGLFELVTVRRERNRQTKRQQGKHEYLLSGMLTCAECGRVMVGTAANKAGTVNALRYYHCKVGGARARSMRPCSVRVNFRADVAERMLWEWVKSLVQDEQELADSLADLQAKRERENDPLRERLKLVEDLIAQNRAELEKATDDYFSSGGKELRALLAKRAAQYEAAIGDLEKQRADVLGKLEVRTLTPAQIRTVQEFAARSVRGFERRKRKAISTSGAFCWI